MEECDVEDLKFKSISGGAYQSYLTGEQLVAISLKDLNLDRKWDIGVSSEW